MDCLVLVIQIKNKNLVVMSVAQVGWSISQMELLTRTLKAIAHPVRLSIIEMLEGERRMTVTEIYTKLNADQSSVSYHVGY